MLTDERKKELRALSKNQRYKRIKEIDAKLEELDLKLTALMAEDRSEHAQKILDRMFGEFKAGARWTKKMAHLAENEYYVYSPIGRRRYLPAALTADKGIVAQQVRRGSNAPVQGMASEIGIKASRLILESYYSNLSSFKKKLGIDKKDWDLRVECSRVVHDANYFSVPYEMVIPFIHILLFQATYGVTKVYKDEFNVEFVVEPEIEIEVAAQDAQQDTKWDYAIPNLIRLINRAVIEAEKIGVLQGSREDVMNEILQPWKSKITRDFLQTKFPLLNITDLDNQIMEAIDNYETGKI